MAKTVRYYITFRGRVQGVGFRYRAQHAAQEYGVTGWVRNEYDGTVSMEAQGTLVSVYQMLDLLESDRWIHIDEKTMREIPVEPAETQFRISF